MTWRASTTARSRWTRSESPAPYWTGETSGTCTGWDGAFPPGVPQRLADLAAVEALAKDRVPPSTGQRLRRVVTLLGRHRTQIEKVTLLDHPDDLPIMWRRLLGQFDCDRAPEHTGAAQPATDLGKTQAMLRGEPPGELIGDGSLVVMRATSRDVTAQATAELLRRLEDRSRAVAIANRDGIILDNAFERVGLPRAGFQHCSPFRAASQVLKLALALIWEPLDPHRLLQFLIHPVSPLSWFVRSRLAEAVAAEPGIGGPAWRAAMTDIDDPANVDFWVAPPRFSVANGAPVAVLRERARQCTRWLVGMLATFADDEQTAVFAAAVSQASALTATTGASGRCRHHAHRQDRSGSPGRRGDPFAARRVDVRRSRTRAGDHPSRQCRRAGGRGLLVGLGANAP